MWLSVKQRWGTPLMGSLLSLIVVSLVLMQQQITPFGDHNFLISDMGSQYVSFFTAYRHAWLDHNFQLYSFSQALGGSLVPTIAYYLMSPFNLLILAFPAAKLLTGITIILMIKLAAIAFTMTAYLQRHFNQQRRAAALFGLAFSLCGFVALNYFDLMWLDALIWLPLVLNGLDQGLQTGKTGRFFWWLWVSIITDFYLGYMTVLFAGYYLIYQLVELKTGSFWAECQRRRQQLGRLLIAGSLSVLSSLVILLPTGFGLLQTAKSHNSWQNFLPSPTFGSTVLAQLGLGVNSYTDRLTHDPTLFSTTIVLLLVGIYFVHPKLTRRSKVHAAGLLITMLLSMWIEGLNTVWHLFQQAAGFPFRNAFFFSFCLILLAYQSWLAQPRLIAKRWQVGLPLILGTLITIGWWSTGQWSSQILSLNWLMIGLAALALFITRDWLQRGLLTGLMMTELGINFSLSMANTPFGHETAYEQAYTTEYQQMAAVNDPDGQLYRVDDANTLINRGYQEKYDNYNDPMLFNFHDIDYYSSTLNETTRSMLQSFGLYSRNVRRISSVGLSPVTDLLLGVKYNVTLRRDGDAQTEFNHSYLGLGFAIPSQLKDLRLVKNQAIVNQEVLLQQLRPQNQRYFLPPQLISEHTTAKPNADRYHYEQTLKLKVTATGPLYFNDPVGTTKYSSFQVNGAAATPVINANASPLLWELGTFKKGAVVTVTFRTQQANLAKQAFASLDQAAFQRVIQQLYSGRFIPQYHAKGFQTVVTGQLNNTQSRSWLYLAIPYDTGWRATVNGQPVNPQRIFTGLTAIPVTAGKNTIRLQYRVPGLRISALISALALISYLSLAAKWFRSSATPTRKSS